MRELVELNKPYTLFVDKPDGTGFSKDYAELQTARAALNLAKTKPNVDRVWLKHYAHSNDAGTVIAEWRRPAHAVDRIHPDSMRELSMLVQLHGVERIKEAVDEIQERLNRENETL